MAIFRDEGTGGGEEKLKPTLATLIKEHNLQDEVNTMMAANKKTLSVKNTELISQLEQLKASSELTKEESEEFQTKIKQLEEQYLSKEELAKRETSKQAKKYQEDLTAATANSKKWQDMYSASTIERALHDAAVETEAEQPFQMVALLRGDTQLVEEGGIHSPIVKFNDKSEDGKDVVLDLSPINALKRMKELPERFGNLFKGSKQGGVGGAGSVDGSTSHPLLKELTDDPVKYAEWRKKNPDLDVSKLRR